MACQNVDGFNETLALFTECPKKHGHKNFYPIRGFSTKQLPECYHDDLDLEKLIHVISDLTVKLEVYFISPNRPKTFQIAGRNHSQISYPLSSESGPTKDPNCGTGIVSQVVENGCGWNVVVNTCKHVVFDDLEASHTECSFSFDFRECRSRNIKAERVICSETDRDVCQIICTIDDENLAVLLKQLAENFTDLRRRVLRLYQKVRGYERKVIIVSYPHAASKYVTVGNVKSDPSDSASSIAYDSDTCPCCSGAYLLVLGGDSFYNTYLHRGSYNDGTNFSTGRLEVGEKFTDLMHPPCHPNRV